MKDVHPLVQRVRNFTMLSAEEERRLQSLGEGSVHTKAARRDVIREGERPRVVYSILSGWACRYKVLEDGRRAIVQLLLPGDLCDIHNVVLTEMDHSIGALTDVRYAEIAYEQLREAEDASANIRHALWWHSTTAIALQREWTVNIGQRSASERLSHLFCELFVRLQTIGLTEDHSFDMPLTQTDLGDATGLTSVHVNRTIQSLREAGLIVLKDRRLTIPDPAALQMIASFSPRYLHLRNQDMQQASGVYDVHWANGR